MTGFHLKNQPSLQIFTNEFIHLLNSGSLLSKLLIFFRNFEILPLKP